MQAALEFTAEHQMDGPLDLDPVQPAKGFGDNLDSVVGLPARRGARMTGMLGAVILDFQHHGTKSLGQGLPNTGLSICQF